MFAKQYRDSLCLWFEKIEGKSQLGLETVLSSVSSELSRINFHGRPTFGHSGVRHLAVVGPNTLQRTLLVEIVSAWSPKYPHVLLRYGVTLCHRSQPKRLR
jgi:hypothetical protein